MLWREKLQGRLKSMLREWLLYMHEANDMIIPHCSWSCIIHQRTAEKTRSRCIYMLQAIERDCMEWSFHFHARGLMLCSSDPWQSTTAGGCCIWLHCLIWLIYWTVRFTSTSVVCVRKRRQFTGVVAGENQWLAYTTHRIGTLDWSTDHSCAFADLIAESGQPYKRTDADHMHSWSSLILAFGFWLHAVFCASLIRVLLTCLRSLS